MTKKPWFWVVVAFCVLTALCCVGSFMVLGVGAFIGSDASGPVSTGGGFSFTPPGSFTPNGAGRVRATQVDGSTTNTVEIISLPAVPGRDDGEAKTQQLWNTVIARDWDEVRPNPVVMRRYVSNGARAFFTGSEVRAKEGSIAFVSVLLVEADDVLMPLVFVQRSADETHLTSTRDMFASYTWGKSWVLAEAAIAGLKGSPVVGTLLSDEEVVGKWQYGSGAQLQWVSAFTGSQGMDVVSYSIEYEFNDDHEYTYSYGGASGTVGALNFQSQKGSGTWKLEHDLLVLTATDGKVKQFLQLGAPTSPQGQRLLHLVPEPNWGLFPGGALANAQLYAPKD